MPGKLFYLEDRRAHGVTESDFTELSMLPIESRPCLVVAKGTVRGVNVEFNIRVTFRLEVHPILGGLIGFDETEYFSEPANIGPGGVLVTSGNADINSFMLVVAANLPFAGGAGSAGSPLPPARAILLARKQTGSGGAVVTNVKITSFPLDEIVATVLN